MNLPPEENKKPQKCPREEITAFIDGELSPAEELEFDLHLANCRMCAEELNAHKKVSTTLEILLEKESNEIDLPENFCKIVKTRAESDVGGLREKKERSFAFFIFAGLILFVFIGLGTEFETVWLAAQKFAGQFLAVGWFVWHAVLELAFVFAVILRFLSQHFVFSSILTVLLISSALIFTTLMLSRMVLRFNRS